MLDFNSKSHLSDRILHYIDEGLRAEAAAEPPRNYLGASEIGGPCDRQLQYSYMSAPKTRDTQGHVIRTRERGHWIEEAAARWYRMGGFTLITEHMPGQQIEVSFLDGKFKGHMDGIFLAGPSMIEYPCGWECKGLGKKNRTPLKKKKVKGHYPAYWAQQQIYMGGMGLERFLFSAWFPDEMDPYHEVIAFDQVEFDRYFKRAERIILACEHGDWLPRCSNSPTYFQCEYMCDYAGTCWGGGE